MKKTLLSISLLASINSAHASVILSTGDTYTSAFTLESVADYFKLTDNFWELSINMTATSADDNITVSLFEDTQATNLIYSTTESLSNQVPGQGLLFGDFIPLFTDHDGSISITYNGSGTAELFDFTVSNFSGVLSPSNVATTTVIAESVTTVPLPAAGWLFLSGLGLLSFFRRNKK